MDMIIILVGLALLLVLTLKKVPVVYAAAISVIFIALFSRLPVVSTMTGDYMTGFANFVKSSWLMLLFKGHGYYRSSKVNSFIYYW